MQALVFDGKVVQIQSAAFPVAPSLAWVDIAGLTPQPEIGWSYDGAVFAPPPPPPLAQIKTAKRQEFVDQTVLRMAAQVPAWNSFARIEFLISIANLLDTASMTAAQMLARDILLFARDTAFPKLAAIATRAELAAIDPAAADPFGDGTTWPT